MVHLRIGMLSVLVLEHNEAGEEEQWAGVWEGLLVSALAEGVDLD